jgi:hypothetical protein
LERKKPEGLKTAVVISALAAAVAALMSVVSCVSVNIGPKPGERSKGVEYNAPEKPYDKLKDTRADSAWQNTVNGNSISYFSTCNDPADPPLETVARDLFSELRDMIVIRENSKPFNSREALDMEVEGKVDGVPTRVRAVIFKKNGCTYTLSHIGVPRAFESDRPKFQTFIESFKAP